MEDKKLKMVNPHKALRNRSLFKLMITVAVIIAVASFLSMIRLRLDLTEDKRFTLSTPTREILSSLENDIYIQVFLDGEIPIPLKRLRRSAMETLEEFRVASGRKVDYEFINPAAGANQEQRNSRYQSLIKKGLEPINIQAGDAEGGSSQKIIFPGMIVNHNGVEIPVNFLRNDPTIPYEENILHSAEGLEYEIIQTIATLSSDTVYRIAFLEGHGEIPENRTADITLNLAKFFTIDRGIIGGIPGSLDNYAAVIVAGPREEFSEADKFVIDQYIMNGGKVLWLIDEVYVNTDSLAFGATAALYRPLNLEDQLFRYGARVNPEIVQDVECQLIRLKVTGNGGRQQFVNVPWIYNPLLVPSGDHPITRNLNRIKGEFVNYIDTVGFDTAIRKTVLLSTSQFTRTVAPPVMISLRESDYLPDEKEFRKSYLPVAVLLEGVFPSAFRNRMVSSFMHVTVGVIRTESSPTKMIVVADGNIITDESVRQDRVTAMTYGNLDFLVNCMNYLVDDRGIMELRSREIKIRLLDQKKIKSEKLKWQLLNILLPVVIVVAAGVVYGYVRRRRFAGKMRREA
jgi:ABC-2 type transport system permease protein